MFDQNTLKVLEFKEIKYLIGGFTTSIAGKKYCDLQFPQKNFSQVKKLLKEVTEMKEFLNINGELSLYEIKNIAGLINKSKKGGSFLLPKEFFDIFSTIKVASKLRSLFYRSKENYPTLYQLSDRIIPLKNLEQSISQVIGNLGELLDNASIKLNKIRIRIKENRERIKNGLRDVLNQKDLKDAIQERVVTLRNGRYVIPVRSDFKKSLPGIVHDQSQSKATYFIEPFLIVDLNNDLNILCRDEKNEEEKILISLTNELRSNADAILTNLALLAKIDLISAKARFSKEISGREPVINQSGKVNLLQARHPILVWQQNNNDILKKNLEERKETDPEDTEKGDIKGKVVPIDIRFERNRSTLVISGANTGGKTVALKTIGLLTLMVQSGMHVPVAEGSETSIFTNVLADIGDEQNIQRKLSTFSAHVAQLNNILMKVDSSSLVLLDEIGVGTDPNEGVALAMSIVDYLRKRNAFVVVTTHLDLLKAYAHLHNDVVNVSVDFDEKTLEPAYRLIYGIPGTSNALLILKKLRVPDEILNKVDEYLPREGVYSAKLIKELLASKKIAEGTREEIGILRDKASKLHKQLELLLIEFKEKKGKILNETKKEARNVISMAEARMKRIIKHLAGNKNDNEKYRKEFFQEKKDLLTHFKSKNESSIDPADIKIGKRFKIIGINKSGTIINVDKNGLKIELLVENLKMKASLHDLEPLQCISSSKKTGENKGCLGVYPVGNSSPEVNLIGMTIDEALPLVDKWLDNAILSGLGEINIIHGLGTGRLLNAIHKHLISHQYVDHFRPADPASGGSGVTVVRIKN